MVVMSWRDDKTLKVRGHFKGFEILSRGSQFKDGEPELFIRGKETYKANLNLENPQGTIQSIESVLRGLDRKAEDEHGEIERQEKALADYRAQLGRSFEHEARLKDLLAKQAQLNAMLDLDKHDAQTVAEAVETQNKDVSAGFSGRVQAEDRVTEMAH
jgi:chromosome segregation ATPase